MENKSTNLSKIRRDEMLSTINEIKKNISDEKTLNNLSMIENELTKKKYGLDCQHFFRQFLYTRRETDICIKSIY